MIERGVVAGQPCARGSSTSSRLDSATWDIHDDELPLAPCAAEASGSLATARFPDGTQLEIGPPEVELRIDPGWMSPSYGRRELVPFVRARRRSRPDQGITQLVLRTRYR